MCRASFGRCLIEADRDILVEDGPRRDLVSIPFDAAAAEDGLLPVFLVAAEAIWRDVTGRGFELRLKRDLGALMSWRIEAIRAEAFSCVLLSVMEAIAAVARPDGVMVLDLARVFDEATARTEARKAMAMIGAGIRAKGDRERAEGDPSQRRRSRRWRSGLRSAFRRRPMRR